MGDANLMNTELDRYHQVTAADILNESNNIFKETNSNTIWYLSKTP
jgi:hypothetical protein